MSAASPGLPLPNLDDRRWDDLVEEGRSLIPLYAPEWTDHNLSDPGITLIELFAWLAEQDLFRIDRVGNEQVRKLLKLAGAVAAPPRPARVVLGVRPRKGLHTALVRRGAEFSGVSTEDAVVRFRAIDRSVVAKATLQAVQVEQGGAFLDRTGYYQRGDAFAPWGENPGPGSALLLGFDHALPTHAAVDLYFSVRDPDDSEAMRRAIRAESNLPEGATLDHHSVRVVWEARTSSGLWVPLTAQDETRAMTLNGTVRLRSSVPSSPSRIGWDNHALHYIRARIASGRHDDAPTLLGLVFNAVVAEQTVVPRNALAATQPPDGSRPPGMSFEPLAPGDGWPSQSRKVSEPQVADGKVVVLTSEDAKVWETWTVRDDFDASDRRATDVVLDATSGTLTFGNGEHGVALPPNATPYVAYLATLADAGNVRAGTVISAAHADSLGAVTQPKAAWGGRAGETLDDVHARVLDTLALVTRAVTVEDIETLARATPGARLAVARAAPESHPDLPGIPAPGVITLTILPKLPAPAPMATPELCRLVSCYVNRRGVPGSRICVVGPIYRKVVVKAELLPAARASADAVRARALANLADFLHPLRGGPDGKGWTIGRDVYRSEVLQALSRTEGVAGVSSLELFLDGGDSECGNLCLGPRGVPLSGDHQVVISPTPASRTRTVSLS